MKRISIKQLRRHIEEELHFDSSVEQIQVTFCCPSFMGGYKKESTQTIGVNPDEVVNTIAERGNKIALGKINTAYNDDNFKRTMFLDIVEL